MKNIGYIYLIENIKNHRIYIGQHKKSSFDINYLGSGLLIKKAIIKYGKENFKIKILSYCKDIDSLNELEIYYINKYKALGYDLYNIASGGFGISKEIASKIAIDRWKNTDIEYRRNHMKKARKAYIIKSKEGTLKIKKCDKCGGTISSHKKECIYYKKVFKSCSECGSKNKTTHFKHCSKYKKRIVSKETREIQSKIHSNRSVEINNKISKKLKELNQSTEYKDKFTCKICGGKSNNHRKDCIHCKECPECGGKNVSHKKCCSKYKPQKKFKCPICYKEITGKGNLTQHMNKKHKENKLNT